MSPGSGREGRIFLGEQSGVGEAVVIGLSEDDMIKDADAEDLRGFDQAVGAVAIFARRSRISGRMCRKMTAAALSSKAALRHSLG